MTIFNPNTKFIILNKVLIKLSYIFFKSSKPTTLIMVLLIGTVTGTSWAQATDKHNEQVTIVSSFDPSINQAYKVNSNPDELQFQMEKPEFSFQSLNVDLPTMITLNPIVPVVINADKRTKLTKNSLKAGVGSLLSPYIDFFHSSGKRNDYRFDAHFYHLSSFKDITDYSPSPQTNTYIDVNVRKFVGKHILDAGIDYSLKTVRYYGFKPSDFVNQPNEDSLKQGYNLARINLGLSSNYKNHNKISHKINLDAYYYFDRFETSESNVNMDFDVHSNFDVSDALNYQELGISGKVSYFNNANVSESSSDLLLSATPYFKGNYGMFNFNVGLNFNLLSTDKSKFYFYPILDVNINLIPDMLTVFAGLDGNVQKQSFYKLSTLNPWVTSTINTEWDNTFIAYGGIRGNVANKVNYSIKVSWEKFNNMFFFVNSPDDTTINYPISVPFNKFVVLHDNGSMFGVSAQITYAASDKVNVNFGAKYNSYTLDSLESAFHKPSSELKLGVSFLITEKIRIWSDLYYYGNRTALDMSVLPHVQIDLDGFIDLNAGVDYKLTKQLSAFLSLTNLLNNQYQRYYNYPVNGIQVMGGIMYKF